MTAEKRNIIFLTENFTEILVPLRFVAADAVMEVGGVERQIVLFFYRIKKVQQRDGIRAARERGDHAVSRFQQSEARAVTRRLIGHATAPRP